VSDTISPGIGSDGVYRDPWGNPYIITMDMDGDNKSRDGFYRLQKVSQQSGAGGFNGLYNGLDDNGGNGDHFEANAPVMVWSFGPDGKIDTGSSATQNANKDNILSWQ